MNRFDSKSWDLFLKELSFYSGGSLSVPEEFRTALEKYFLILMERNELVNLTAIEGWESGLFKHLLDSLSLVYFKDLGSVLDWGTGGGLPGIPLLLWRRLVEKSDKSVDFVDSVGKKIISVRYFLDQLGFDGERLAHIKRGEALLADIKFDSVVMRAVAPPERALAWLSPRAKSWLIFCGPKNREAWLSFEKQIGKKGLLLTDEHKYELPLGLGSRSILRFSSKK